MPDFGYGKPEEAQQSIEQFMNADESTGLLFSDDSFSEFLKKKGGPWYVGFGGDYILRGC